MRPRSLRRSSRCVCRRNAGSPAPCTAMPSPSSRRSQSSGWCARRRKRFGAAYSQRSRTIVPSHSSSASVREILPEVGDRAVERASGAPASLGNSVRLLLGAKENLPAWLEAIRAAERKIFFEMYIITDDDVGREFVAALIDRARAGVQVCVVYDWLGSAGLHGPGAAMRQAGAQVRAI